MMQVIACRYTRSSLLSRYSLCNNVGWGVCKVGGNVIRDCVYQPLPCFQPFPADVWGQDHIWKRVPYHALHNNVVRINQVACRMSAQYLNTKVRICVLCASRKCRTYSGFPSAGGSDSCTSRPAPAIVGGDADNASTNAALNEDADADTNVDANVDTNVDANADADVNRVW